MQYIYSPILKYIILLICIFMFIKHLKIMINKQNLMITVTIMFMIIIFDYILIDKHPDLFSQNNDKESFIASHVSEDIITDRDIAEVLNNYNVEDLEEELDSESEQLNYPNSRQKAFYQIPTDEKKPTYELNEDCYRRGNQNINSDDDDKYYSHDIL